jgi:hypothetical protein
VFYIRLRGQVQPLDVALSGAGSFLNSHYCAGGCSSPNAGSVRPEPHSTIANISHGRAASEPPPSRFWFTGCAGLRVGSAVCTHAVRYRWVGWARASSGSGSGMRAARKVQGIANVPSGRGCGPSPEYACGQVQPLPTCHPGCGTSCSEPSRAGRVPPTTLVSEPMTQLTGKSEGVLHTWVSD